MLQPKDSLRPNWTLRIFLLALLLALIAVIAAGLVWVRRMTHMPLQSFSGSPPSPATGQTDLATSLAAHVNELTVSLGERNIPADGSLAASAEYLRATLEKSGYTVTEHPYQVQGHTVSNIEAILAGSQGETIVVGAHYDSVEGTVGANDNATGVAAVLELARMLHGSMPKRSIRFVLFVNEEPPYFQTSSMGSLVYARELRRAQVPVKAMISLETIGYYSDAANSQKYPPGLSQLYPNQGNFVAFVGNSGSRDLVRRSIAAFRSSTSFPSEGAALPAALPGVGWSDHWSFWQAGYPAIMITDTAPFRYRYYHTPADTAGKLDFPRMAIVVDGVRRVIESLANE